MKLLKDKLNWTFLVRAPVGDNSTKYVQVCARMYLCVYVCVRVFGGAVVSRLYCRFSPLRLTALYLCCLH